MQPARAQVWCIRRIMAAHVVRRKRTAASCTQFPICERVSFTILFHIPCDVCCENVLYIAAVAMTVIV
jgi:hypothetical protein